MRLLYFWRGDNYRRDLDHGAGFHLNQANPLLHQIGIGESLWAFTRKLDRRYGLAAELVISAKTMNPHGFVYEQGDFLRNPQAWSIGAYRGGPPWCDSGPRPAAFGPPLAGDALLSARARGHLPPSHSARAFISGPRGTERR